MSKRILIDMMKIREAMAAQPDLPLPEAFCNSGPGANGLKSVVELAAFMFTCRKCQDAPCIDACPAEALEKDEGGIICRHTNLCISCKSCAVICPFGTMMTDFFRHHRNRDFFYDLTEPGEMEKFAAACPPGTVSVTDAREVPEENIFRLNEKVLIKDIIYQADIVNN
jgi:Fe-S-cluster-containing hydrogenase component 2